MNNNFINSIPSSTTLKNTFKFDNAEVTSNFDSANLINCTQINDNSLNLFIGEDCYCVVTPNPHSIYKTWFYFSIKCFNEMTFNLTIVNLNNFSKIFNDGYQIVYQDINTRSPDDFEKSYSEDEEYLWKRLDRPISCKVDSVANQMSISFDFQFIPNHNVLFAFCYPWSYEKNLKFVEFIESKAKLDSKLYFHREVLINSKEKRKVELLTISAKDNIIKAKENLFKGMFPNSNRCCACLHDRPIIFMSARVHPGETPSSFALNSIIKFLVSNDERAQVLLKSFVFKIIPIINVDGVSRGHFRLDSTGINLNRCYMDSDVKSDPEIYAIKKLFLYYSSDFKVRYYFDLHADMQCSGVYTFGNAVTDYMDQVENVLFPFIFSLSCQNVNFPRCNFTERSMKTKFKNEKQSKEGTSRVFFYKKTGLIHAYTVESTYFRGQFNPDEVKDSKIYTVEDFLRTGQDLLITILEYEEINPSCKLQETNYKTIADSRTFIANYVLTNEERYKFEIALKAKAKEINTLKSWLSINEINNKQKDKILRKSSIKKCFYPKINKTYRASKKEISLNSFNINTVDHKNISSDLNKNQMNPKVLDKSNQESNQNTIPKIKALNGTTPLNVFPLAINTNKKFELTKHPIKPHNMIRPSTNPLFPNVINRNKGKQKDKDIKH